MSFYKKDEDSGEAFSHLDKTTVIQEARVFNESPVKARHCRIILAKIIGLLYHGDTLSTKEATELFFGITKLFQSADPSLRQIVYLAIKELSGIAEDVIIITSSLMKDMQPKSEITNRANAIRALCRITDASMLQGIERFIKASIIDRSHQVSSASVISAYHLFRTAPGARDVIKRWSNEVQEALQAKSGGGLSSYLTSSSSQINVGTSNVVQYHALGLLYQLRQHDRMAVTKLVQALGPRSGGGLMGGGPTLKSPLAICMLIRCACRVMEEDASARQELYELLESYLRNKSDMVNFEAAKAICNLPDVTNRELYPAISVLQLFLSSPKATMRFAAIRALNTLAQHHPTAVAPCNIDMESLITDNNRSIATFAITTLLKTGNEASVDRLMKQIQSFMSEITDEFRCIVVAAVRSLALKFPAKQQVMLSFLSGVLRDEGGYEFKRSVVDAIFDMCKYIPDAKPAALSHLCEFIEDCEFSKLSARVLHFLGVEGPQMPNPTVYIRHIYNRVVLENAMVRAAAVSALAKFGVNCDDSEVKQSVRVLLTRCLDDRDDEVRDRAAMYVRTMEDQEVADHYVREDSSYSLAALERSLVEYCKNLEEAAEKPFDASAIPRVTREQEATETLRKCWHASTAASKGAGAAPAGSAGAKARAVDRQQVYAEQLEKVAEFASYGPLYHSTKPVALTESETEYVVSCVRHVFAEHIVFQFDCTNTINDQLLENVLVQMDALEISDEEALEPAASVPAPTLKFDEPGVAYVAFHRIDSTIYPSATFSCSLKFVVKDCDPSTGVPDAEGYEDEYQIEDVELATATYVTPTFLGDFDSVWRSLGDDNEAVETFALTALNSLQAAVTSVVEVLGLHPLQETVTPTSSAVHTLLLQGTFAGGAKVAARVRMTYAASSGVTMELAVRSDRDDVPMVMINAIA
ncbi:coatomer subunit gamma [Thamnocephalis sphaerospora]|uniref:Coatomer subunit gamma n=1 Tax=Thamnocephalis sphaerospora TaxID=78915 RepID=A0A4P9XTD5_9FUNG|nr:coatomer subunit gamma [Thamnocephalis sphaerospora]|eukprot:RKP08801.1 coatomer subunit gamma [Thamnocephalis sphaerospora]